MCGALAEDEWSKSDEAEDVAIVMVGDTMVGDTVSGFKTYATPDR
jgi:hypothetical protein